MPTGATWEHEVADYLRSRGYHPRVRETVGNHEIDVYATRGSEKLAVECKNWNSSVTKDPVRTVHNNANEIGARPGLAYTSDLTSGARELADKYEVVLISDEVVRGEVLTFEDIVEAVRGHSICLPDVSDLSQFGEPIDPFVLNTQFAEDVGEAARQHAFEMDSRGKEAVADEVERHVENTDASRCVPVLRNDRGRIDLYFVTDSHYEALPDQVHKESIPLA